jgi:hypothetical protein
VGQEGRNTLAFFILDERHRLRRLLEAGEAIFKTFVEELDSFSGKSRSSGARFPGKIGFLRIRCEQPIASLNSQSRAGCRRKKVDGLDEVCS